MGTKAQFEQLAAKIQPKHQRYFDSLERDQSKFKNIHEHYYIFTGADGAHLRFQSDSELPADIREDLPQAFDNLLIQSTKE